MNDVEGDGQVERELVFLTRLRYKNSRQTREETGNRSDEQECH